MMQEILNVREQHTKRKPYLKPLDIRSLQHLFKEHSYAIPITHTYRVFIKRTPTTA